MSQANAVARQELLSTLPDYGDDQYLRDHVGLCALTAEEQPAALNACALVVGDAMTQLESTGMPEDFVFWESALRDMRPSDDILARTALGRIAAGEASLTQAPYAFQLDCLTHCVELVTLRHDTQGYHDADMYQWMQANPIATGLINTVCGVFTNGPAPVHFGPRHPDLLLTGIMYRGFI